MTSRVWAAVNPIAGSAVSNGGPDEGREHGPFGHGQPGGGDGPREVFDDQGAGVDEGAVEVEQSGAHVRSW